MSESYQDTIERLYSPLTQLNGESEENICQAENQLKYRLPHSLREYYLLAGQEERLNNANDRLLNLSELSIKNQVLIFYVENQSVNFFCIRVNEIALDNPPVYAANFEDLSNLELNCESLTQFFYTMNYWQLVNGALENCALTFECSQETISLIESIWPEMMSISDVWKMRIFSKDQQLLCLLGDQTNCQLQIAASTPSEARKITKLLPVEWEINEIKYFIS
ncbi:MAG: hypothetical protein VSS75_010500 [Candidatus Parabeggiatoa sp.]|nr:hypothetical protein [Candidatus Parabeggiatoa sp.]